MCKVPVPSICHAHNPKGNFLSRFPADRAQSAVSCISFGSSGRSPSGLRRWPRSLGQCPWGIGVCDSPARLSIHGSALKVFLLSFHSVSVLFSPGCQYFCQRNLLRKLIGLSHISPVPKLSDKRASIDFSWITTIPIASFCWDRGMDPWVTDPIPLANGCEPHPWLCFLGKPV